MMFSDVYSSSLPYETGPLTSPGPHVEVRSEERTEPAEDIRFESDRQGSPLQSTSRYGFRRKSSVRTYERPSYPRGFETTPYPRPHSYGDSSILRSPKGESTSRFDCRRGTRSWRVWLDSLRIVRHVPFDQNPQRIPKPRPFWNGRTKRLPRRDLFWLSERMKGQCSCCSTYTSVGQRRLTVSHRHPKHRR